MRVSHTQLPSAISEYPQNIQDLIHFMVKTGFITRELWNDYFATGMIRHKFRRFKHLIDTGLLIPISQNFAKDTFIFSRKAVEKLFGSFSHVTRPPYLDRLYHDTILSKSMLELQKCGFIKNWKTEGQLKKEKALTQRYNSIDQKKYPDIEFEVIHKNESRLIAIEYEKSCKSKKRYKEILLNYQISRKHLGIIYVCETAGIKNTIKATMKKIGTNWLDQHICFCMVNDWKKDPYNTKLELDGGFTAISSWPLSQDIEKAIECPVEESQVPAAKQESPPDRH